MYIISCAQSNWQIDPLKTGTFSVQPSDVIQRLGIPSTELAWQRSTRREMVLFRFIYASL